MSSPPEKPEKMTEAIPGNQAHSTDNILKGKIATDDGTSSPSYDGHRLYHPKTGSAVDYSLTKKFSRATKDSDSPVSSTPDSSEQESDVVEGSVHKPSKPKRSLIGSYAFAFDIDGVLLRGSDVIPEGIEALKTLNGDNKYHVQVPYIFVTNGGGKTEKHRGQDLSDKLHVPISSEQIIQGHTPMKELAKVYDNVLVVGGEGEACRKVAETYGFKHIYTPGDILKWNPNVSPFRKLTPEEYKNSEDFDFSKIEIEAILVFADSREWASDQQIILDLLMSVHGRMGTVSKTFDEGPDLFFSHGDFVWATNYDLSRYGMGALQVSISALFKAHTGKDLKLTKYGKPNKETFLYAEKVLTKWRKALTGVDAPPTTVYFIGDTPESDVRFANRFDDTWYSILVETGVYQAGTVPKYKPKKICKNVLEAVNFALDREHEKIVSGETSFLHSDSSLKEKIESLTLDVKDKVELAADKLKQKVESPKSSSD